MADHHHHATVEKALQHDFATGAGLETAALDEQQGQLDMIGLHPQEDVALAAGDQRQRTHQVVVDDGTQADGQLQAGGMTGDSHAPTGPCRYTFTESSRGLATSSIPFGALWSRLRTRR